MKEIDSLNLKSGPAPMAMKGWPFSSKGDDIAIARGRVAECPDTGNLRIREDRTVELRGFLGFLVEPEMRCD